MDQKLIDEIAAHDTPLCIGISGFGGSGKSTFAAKLAQALHCPVVGVDAFIKDRTLAAYAHWNLMDYERLEHEVLDPFMHGEKIITYGHFDWARNTVHERITIACQDFLIVEGAGLFRPRLNRYFGYKIWIDCPLDTAIARGKRRDREEYGEPHDELWDGLWRRNDEGYFKDFKPMEVADITIKE